MNEENVASITGTAAYPPPTNPPQHPTAYSLTFTHDSEDLLPSLLTQALIIPESKTAEGVLIASIALPWRGILKLITEDPNMIYQIDPWKWEEIIAGSYVESGQFDEGS